MDINQIYRAPSITKLSKRNISSSLIRGASNISSISSAPKLKSSSFSFKPKSSEITLSFKPKSDTNTFSFKPKSDEQKAQILSSVSVTGNKEEEKNNKLSKTRKFKTETLSETNRILVEIQQQLSLDFAMRIAEEKEIVKKIKATESKKRFAAKEATVESVKKIGSTLNNAFDKVIAPAKNIFSRMVEFFQLILTGIVLNAAFKWLQNPLNRAKLDSVIEFVGDHWKEILAVFIGVKIFGVLYKIYGAAKLLKGIIDFILKKPPGGGRGGGGSPLDCAGVMKCFSTSVVPFLAANPRVVNQIGESVIKDRRFLTGLTAALGISALSPGSAPTLAPTWASAPTSAAPNGSSNWLSGISQSLSNAGYAANEILDIIKAIGAPMFVLQGAQARAEGGTIESPKKKCNSCSLGFSGGNALHASEGMTVPGKGSGLVDSVKALLAPGEEVIRTASANLFRPVLKDINENAGRLWVLFSRAVKKLLSVTDYQNEVSKQFQKTIESFDKYLKDEIFKKKTSKKVPGGGGGGRSMSMNARSDKKSVSATPKVYNYNLISQGNSSGGMTFLPMNLPPIKSKPPEIPMPSNPATEVPVISSVNMANPYMQLTPEIYGIFV